uniref:histidine kinase n=1 Tax=Magnetococcus massalia (strain MO-1) TaxID=451514 RepID=A0A1S7LFN8_MAGMO|nr:Putative signal transduction histidine kinase with PAS domain [Candidatus Magnetococcus massalia]
MEQAFELVIFAPEKGGELHQGVKSCLNGHHTVQLVLVEHFEQLETLTQTPKQRVVLYSSEQYHAGLPLIERVRGAFPELPLIYYAPAPADHLAEDPVSLGISEFLPKPHSYSTLTHRLLAHFRHHAATTDAPAFALSGESEAPHQGVSMEFSVSHLIKQINSGLILVEVAESVVITAFNPACERLFGIQEQRVVGRELKDIFPELCQKELIHSIRQVWQERSRLSLPPVQHEMQPQSKWLHVELFSYTPQLVGILVSDITQLKLDEERITTQMQARIQQQEETEKQLRETIREVDKGQRLSNLIMQVTSLSLAKHPIEYILQRALEMLLELPEFNVLPKGAIFLKPAEERQLNMIASLGLQESAIWTRCQQIPFGLCLCGRLAESDQDMMVTTESLLSVGHDVQFEGMEPHGHVHVKMVGREGVQLGIITLYLRHSYSPSMQELDMLRTIANTLSGVVERDHAEKAAESAAVAKQEFLANIGHELRTPLHNIMSFTERGLKKLKQGEVEKDRLLRYFGNVQKGGERLLLLLNDLLDLSKLEAGRMQFNLRDYDFNTLVDDVCEEFSQQFQNKSLTVKCGHSLAEGKVSIDPVRMLQVLRNIFSNAVKFTPEGGKIEVVIEEVVMAGGRRKSDPESVNGIRLTITDSGIGIPEEELETVFDKFAQSSRSKTGAGGTGLGLAICREIMTAHVGTIHAERVDGAGARLIVELPRERISSEKGEEGEESSSA